MAKKKQVNPFYILLLVSGGAFAITAMAFGVMTVRSLQATRNAGYGPIEVGEKSLISATGSFDELLDRYGTNAMIFELVLLTIGTVGAIGYDQHLDRTAITQQNLNPEEKK